MKSLTGQQIRRLYKQFFEQRGHHVFPSASLVPQGDATLLWINAGMAPLKPFFDGREIPEHPRLVSAQKCIRTNDIENVGRTARHQTFFEMLGNFSFGDYFKQSAIPWAWEFVTTGLGLDAQKLWVTVHHTDEEAYRIWEQDVGVATDRIVRGDEDNFWEIGEGPCGPCSEVFYDRGMEFGCGRENCGPSCDCDRYLEIWNLVFTQYNKGADGKYTPLPKKNIDTGMGLERVASILQGVENNFETDLFLPLIEETARQANKAYKENAQWDVHFKIIADHIRTVVFALGDGALPGNEGRNYVIRRLLRRAARSGRKLGLERPFLHGLVSLVAQIMGDDYPEVAQRQEFIRRVVRTEEKRFGETLAEGEALLADRLAALKQMGGSELTGEDAFRLYDTFGFPLDLTEEIAAEEGIQVDRDGFGEHLAAQRQRARAARQTQDGMNAQRGALETITTPSRFVGYDQLVATARVTAIVVDGQAAPVLTPGQRADVLLDVTPLYAESGGQVADSGVLVADTLDAQVEHVRKAPHGQNVHTIKLARGTLRVGDEVVAKVQPEERGDTVKNHTATHLLHQALRDVLGTHVAQAGSLVEPRRLRFDFSHIGPLTAAEIREVEDRVNAAIDRDDPVVTEEMELETAKAIGAKALFGEKYGHRVRVVHAGEWSIELCGGCHIERTGLIGLFCIVSETGIGSGLRRIEAVTGRYARQLLLTERDTLRQAADALKLSHVAEVPERLLRTLEDMRALEHALATAQSRLRQQQARALADSAQQVAGVPVISAVVAGVDADELRALTDAIRQWQHSGVIALGTGRDDKALFVTSVSADWQQRGLHAGQIVKRIAAVAGGGGGGRADFAQAGGKDGGQVGAAIASVAQVVSNCAGNRDGVGESSQGRG